MTTYYVDSAGSNTAPYDTWAKAANSLATIAAIDAAGDTIYVASTHNESTAGLISWAWAGTATSPTQILCADKTSGAPPSTLATGGMAANTGNNLFQPANTGVVYFYGLTLICGSTSQSFTLSTSRVEYDTCSFQLSGGSGTSLIDPALSTWLNCTVKFSAVGQRIGQASGSAWTWSGGSILSGSASPTNLFSSPSAGSKFLVENVDLSNLSASFNIASGSNAGPQITFRNCSFPSAWTGSLNASTPGANAVYTLNQCDSAGTNYILHRQTQFGDVYSETTVIRSGGASDGTTPLSWKMVSLAASGTFPITALQTGEFVIWNDTTGSSVTVTVEGIVDSATNLQNNQVWLEVDYYGASGNPQGSLASSAMANVLSTPVDLTASTATWNNTGGMTNPNKFKLQVTFTPQLKGFLLAAVKLCKASTTIYIDPLLTVS